MFVTHFKFLLYFILQRNTDEGSLPKRVFDQYC